MAGDPDAEEPALEEAAKALAEALSVEDLTRVQFIDLTGQRAQRRWEGLVAGMGDAAHETTLSGIREGEDEATATLLHEWVVDGHTWAYETTARLTRGADSWAVAFESAMVEPSLLDGERLRVKSLPAPRGDILGAGGKQLVTDRPVVRFGIDKTQVAPAQQARSARELARVLGIDAESFASRVDAAGEEAFVEGLVLRVPDVTGSLRRSSDLISGAAAVSDEIPLAPTREFARPILGAVGPVTAEMLKESGGKYDVGDVVGLFGLQERYESSLAGRPGVVVEAVVGEEESRELFRAGPVPGQHLRTSLDLRLQHLAERTLVDVGPASALVAVRPSDGHILAAASGPGSEGYSTATVGRYAPGSTFKIVTSLALLRAGVTPEAVLPCTRTATVNGKTFENYDDYPSSALGEVTLRTAVAHSCNTSFIGEHTSVTQAALAEAAAALGLGIDHDLGFPAYFGSVPREATATGHAASMIGQGELLASPMAMAVVAASVAAGHVVVPTLLPDRVVGGAEPERPITEQEASALRDMMRTVVTQGSARFLADVPGAPVLAKTGTAEFGTAVPPDTHGWMIGVQGDLAVAAFVELADSGSETAGPILEEFLRGVA